MAGLPLNSMKGAIYVSSDFHIIAPKSRTTSGLPGIIMSEAGLAC